MDVAEADITATVEAFTHTPWSAAPVVRSVMGAVRSLGTPSGLRTMPAICTLDFPLASEMTSALVPSRETLKSFTVRPESHDGVMVTLGIAIPGAMPVGL
ncbi:hypothetical protein D3C79_955600 [compost metagenome]